MSTSYISAELRRLVIARAERLCEYCLIQEDDTYFGCEVDHIISESTMARPTNRTLRSPAWLAIGTKAAMLLPLSQEPIGQFVSSIPDRIAGASTSGWELTGSP